MIDIGKFSIVRFTAQLLNTMTKMNLDMFAYYVVYRILMKTTNISIVYMICTITPFCQQTVLSQCIKRTLLIIGVIICNITINSLIITYLILEKLEINVMILFKTISNKIIFHQVVIVLH